MFEIIHVKQYVVKDIISGYMDKNKHTDDLFIRLTVDVLPEGCAETIRADIVFPKIRKDDYVMRIFDDVVPPRLMVESESK